MKNLINNVLRRLGFSYDGEDSNSGWDANQEHKWAPSDTNEDAQHKDDRFTSVTFVEGDAELSTYEKCPVCGHQGMHHSDSDKWCACCEGPCKSKTAAASTEENNAKRLSDVQKWVTRYQVETDEHGSIVLYHATPKGNAAAVAQTGLPKGTLLETTPEAALFFTCDSKDISRTDVVLYAVHVPPFVLSPGKFGSLLDDLDATFITPVELPTQEEFKKTDAPKETDVMPKSIGWLKRANELSEETLKTELAASLSVDSDDISIKETDDNGGTFDAVGGEYRFFWTEDLAEEAAKEQVRSDLEDSPEIFNQDWLQSHISISDTDKRIIASEEADNMVDEGGMDDQQILEKAGMTDEYEVADDDAKEGVLEDAKEKAREVISDEIENELADPIQYFVNDHGIYSVEDLLKANFIQTDIDAATDDAVATDGWAHFLSHYDGGYETTAEGVIYFREN